MAAFDEEPSIWFGVSPAVIDAAREALTEGRPAYVRVGHKGS